MYDIEIANAALDDLKSFRKFEQRYILDNVETQLRHDPTVDTRNRKRLLPNEVASWELRLGQFRVFYNVDEKQLVVRIEAVGFKVGNLLFIRAESTQL